MKDERGFTLIELMIVVAIIAILAGILIPNFVNARAQAQTAACESNLRSIATAAELYYSDQQSYPASGNLTSSATNFTAGTVNYLTNIPTDPASTTVGSPYVFTNTSSAGSPGYTIQCPGAHDASTLNKLRGSSTSTHTILYTSGTGLSAQ